MALLRQFLPVGFVQLWADEEIQVLNFIVFAEESGREPELGMRFDFEGDLFEHVSRYDVYFVQNHQTPFAILNELHHFL